MAMRGYAREYVLVLTLSLALAALAPAVLVLSVLVEAPILISPLRAPSS